MTKAIQIGKEVVVLAYTERDGKVTVGGMRVLPLGVWKNLCRRVAH
jgi:hypothetical protein